MSVQRILVNDESRSFKEMLGSQPASFLNICDKYERFDPEVQILMSLMSQSN